MLTKEEQSKIKPGVKARVYEGKTPFTGLVIARKHGSEPGATFTVRSQVAGIGVEKVYPIHSPILTKLEVVDTPKKVRRNKLYYVRDMSTKKIRRKLGTSI